MTPEAQSFCVSVPHVDHCCPHGTDNRQVTALHLSNAYFYPAPVTTHGTANLMMPRFLSANVPSLLSI